jgi:hypothetical protein
VIGSLGALVILLLSVPFDVAVELDVHGKPKFTLNLAWFFGLINKKVESKKKVAKPKKPEKLRPKVRRNKTLGTIRFIIDIIRTKGLIGQTAKLVKRTYRRVKIKSLEAEWNVGLDDPYETFQLFTLTEPINQILYYSQPYPINIRPNFIEPVLEGYAKADVRLYPIQFVPPFLMFIFSIPTFRVIRKIVRSRWRRKR